MLRMASASPMSATRTRTSPTAGTVVDAPPPALGVAGGGWGVLLGDRLVSGDAGRDSGPLPFRIGLDHRQVPGHGLHASPRGDVLVLGEVDDLRCPGRPADQLE